VGTYRAVGIGFLAGLLRAGRMHQLGWQREISTIGVNHA
jgi:hypothetical protein